MQEEVEGGKVGQLESLYRALDHPLEVRRYAFRSQVIAQHLVPLGLIGDDPDVGRIAFVTRPRVREMNQLYLWHIFKPLRPIFPARPRSWV